MIGKSLEIPFGEFEGTSAVKLSQEAQNCDKMQIIRPETCVCEKKVVPLRSQSAARELDNPEAQEDEEQNVEIMTKERANNNRTLTISKSEIPELRKRIVEMSEINGGESFIDKLIHGNVLDVLDKIPNGIADLIIIDPPYNLSKDYNGMKFNARKTEAYDDYLRTWFHKVCMKLKKNGSLYMCGDWKCTSSLQRVLEEELIVLNRITWQREKGRGAKANWKNAMEDIWFGVKSDKDYYFNVDAVMQKRKVIAPYKVDGKPKDWEETTEGNFRITYPSNFWDDISIPFWSMPENTDHPTQKPEKLYAKLVLASSRPGELVFDPFMGSGTACVVAQKLGRHYLGIEINDEYCLWSAKRISQAEKEKSIQGYWDGVFWERNTLALQKKSFSTIFSTTPKS